jgi:hypothetical protein
MAQAVARSLPVRPLITRDFPGCSRTRASGNLASANLNHPNWPRAHNLRNFCADPAIPILAFSLGRIEPHPSHMETVITADYHLEREVVLHWFAGREQRVLLLQPSQRPTGNTSTEVRIGILFALDPLKRGVTPLNLFEMTREPPACAGEEGAGWICLACGVRTRTTIVIPAI